MFAGKLIYTLCYESTQTLIQILQYKKLDSHIPTLRKIANFFQILSEVDVIFYKLYTLKTKQIKLPGNFANLSLIIGIFSIELVIKLIDKIKYAKVLSYGLQVDIDIIRLILQTCIKSIRQLIILNSNSKIQN
ncbi:MAG: hypothetical protein ABDH21_05895 [bacterium]